MKPFRESASRMSTMYQPISTGATTSNSTPRKMVLPESPCGNGHQNRTIATMASIPTLYATNARPMSAHFRRSAGIRKS
ncbi:MAG: hypothetical protein JWM87_111 [Candidatus Eremiobacteraeota bacterium]|nr:hypothetical protein [Candidatus Eremiobacteraeota bacterium]